MIPSSSNDKNDDDEEKHLLEYWDEEITKVEERTLLRELDEEILQQEERELMEQFRQEIEHDEMAAAGVKPSKVEGLEDISDISSQKTNFDDSTWMLRRVNRKKSDDHDQTHRRKNRNATFLYSEVKESPLFAAKVAVPRILQKGTPAIFTKEQFHHDVIKGIEAKFRREKPVLLEGWYANIRDPNPENLSIYVLEARGREEALQHLRQMSQKWIDHMISAHNLRFLLESAGNLELDVVVDGTSLGIFLPKVPELSSGYLKKIKGVWGPPVKPAGELARTVGSLTPFKEGYAIVAIEGHECTDVLTLMRIFKNEKMDKKKQTLTVTLCVPKHTDLDRIRKDSVTIRRKDGKPYHPQDFKKIRDEYKVLRQSFEASRKGKSWMEYPPKHAPRPKKYLPTPVSPEISETEMTKVMDSILCDRESVEVEFICSPLESLGASCTTFHISKRSSMADPSGIWVQGFKEHGQLIKCLGKKGCKYGGAVLLEANGFPVRSFNDLTVVKDEAKVLERPLIVTLVLINGTDLSEIDRTKLVQGKVNPRRRHGEPYPLHLRRRKTPTTSTKSSRKRLQNKKRALVNDDDAVAPAGEKRKSKKARRTVLTDGGHEGEVSEERKPKRSSALVDGLANYQKFKEKYKPVVEAEFEKCEITFTKIVSSMWHQHKKLKGDKTVCDDTCDCIAHFSDLTATVLDDYITDQRKKKQNYTTFIRTSGLAQFFIPRFLPLLHKERPKETPSELIHRLLEMWSIHKSQRIFGSQCRKDCQCTEAFELAFGRGDKSKARSTKSTPKRTMKGLSKTVATLSKNHPSTMQSNNNNKTSNISIPRRMSSTSSTGGGGGSKYDVAFDFEKPLGAYFLTEINEGICKCKIASIWSYGQVKKDRRIRPGKSHDLFCFRF